MGSHTQVRGGTRTASSCFKIRGCAPCCTGTTPGTQVSSVDPSSSVYPPSRRSPSTKTSSPSSKRRPPSSPSRTSSKPRTSNPRALRQPCAHPTPRTPHHNFLQCIYVSVLLSCLPRAATHPHTSSHCF